MSLSVNDRALMRSTHHPEIVLGEQWCKNCVHHWPCVLVQLLDTIHDYENRLNWGTTCQQCATLLDRCYESDMEAEGLREREQRVRALHAKATWANVCDECFEYDEWNCVDHAPWPCPTITALDAPVDNTDTTSRNVGNSRSTAVKVTSTPATPLSDEGTPKTRGGAPNHRICLSCGSTDGRCVVLGGTCCDECTHRPTRGEVL